MTRWVAVAAVVLFCAHASVEARAGTLLYEPFNYPVGDALDGKVAPNGQTWAALSGNPADDDIVVASTNLAVDGLPAPQGNSLFYQGLGKSQRVALASAPITSGTIYYSLAFQLGDILPVTTPVFIAGFNNIHGPQSAQASFVATRLYVKAGATPDTFQIGVLNNSSVTADVVFDGVDHAYNTTQFVVGSYEIVPGGLTNDAANLWVNPSSATFGGAAAPAPTLTAAPGNDLNVGGFEQVDSFLFRQGFARVPYTNADELRVGTAWADVTSTTGGGVVIPLPLGVWGALAIISGMVLLRLGLRLNEGSDGAEPSRRLV